MWKVLLDGQPGSIAKDGAIGCVLNGLGLFEALGVSHVIDALIGSSLGAFINILLQTFAPIMVL
eukprot:CAMPEP_0194051398 /NCGR_PEP_ID=MMETSP0009_2-20130614/40259_1 /TAXON_ID=210454 /ORGANISM="Grammatophora oceanica, Strain CCMP 410" /LENGTH=63 /DNA_ID=CAMNT_0038698455 /DNA_START=173 /DNA_END=364 /DNA_ORIENTATION=-